MVRVCACEFFSLSIRCCPVVVLLLSRSCIGVVAGPFKACRFFSQHFPPSSPCVHRPGRSEDSITNTAIIVTGRLNKFNAAISVTGRWQGVHSQADIQLLPPPYRGEALQATPGWQRIPAIHVFFSEPEVPRPTFVQVAYFVSEAPMCGH